MYTCFIEILNARASAFIFSFILQTTQKRRNVNMFKTNVCKSLSVEAMCCILGKTSEVTDAPVLIINR